MRTLTIQYGVESIGSSAFWLCGAADITIPYSVKSVGSATFGYGNVEKLTILSSQTRIGDGAFSTNPLSEVLYNGTLDQWYAANFGSYGLPANTTLQCIDFILPEALTVIEDEAFTGGDFHFAKLPEEITSIGRNAFADCLNLTCIYIPSNPDIDPEAFGDQTELTIICNPFSIPYVYAREHGFHYELVPYPG